MLYELETYDLKPRVMPAVEQHLADCHLAAGEPPELVGSFHTEFGPLNQIVQIRRFNDFGHYARTERTRDTMGAHANDVLRHTRELMTPVALSPPLTAGLLGPFYELRTYIFPPAQLDRLLNAWARAMPARDALGSPVAAIWTSCVGTINSLTHLWPYQSLEERERIRLEVRRSGLWPPYKLDEAEGGSGYEITAQTNKLLLPARFSPLQ